jgi:hypothetical protein
MEWYSGYSHRMVHQTCQVCGEQVREVAVDNTDHISEDAAAWFYLPCHHQADQQLVRGN